MIYITFYGHYNILVILMVDSLQIISYQSSKHRFDSISGLREILLYLSNNIILPFLLIKKVVRAFVIEKLIFLCLFEYYRVINVQNILKK